MLYRFNNTKLKLRRKDLRKKATDSEKILWYKIRDRKLGAKFFRQYSVEGYVIDFYCPAKRLALEIDGGYHALVSAQIYDMFRQRLIEAYKIHFLRFSSNDIELRIDEVLNSIRSALLLA